MIAVSAFVSLCSKDLQKKFGISAGAVEVLRQVYFYQHGSLQKCIASKDTIARHSKLSRRAVYYALRQLHQKGVIHRRRRAIIVSTALLRYVETLKQKYNRLVSWQYYSKIKTKWLWRKSGQSVENLYKKIFSYGDACTMLESKLHPNSRFKSSDLNNNSRTDKSSVSIRALVIKTIKELPLEQLKELYLERIKEKGDLRVRPLSSLTEKTN